ncbi:hypothetical protein ACJ73_05153 [Blastomyces percursus]|uniref:Uncharacterized protein n=1 Tax=Blastomyces percursus TaxID=1658174 RepID=A0A1J9QTE0_9EURO|nr:hypothetical protein ACJ73_05153 [Blastomyces percursus]
MELSGVGEYIETILRDLDEVGDVRADGLGAHDESTTWWLGNQCVSSTARSVCRKWPFALCALYPQHPHKPLKEGFKSLI